jgi:hypothetical protein
MASPIYANKCRYQLANGTQLTYRISPHSVPEENSADDEGHDEDSRVLISDDEKEETPATSNAEPTNRFQIFKDRERITSEWIPQPEDRVDEDHLPITEPQDRLELLATGFFCMDFSDDDDSANGNLDDDISNKELETVDEGLDSNYSDDVSEGVSDE